MRGLMNGVELSEGEGGLDWGGSLLSRSARVIVGGVSLFAAGGRTVGRSRSSFKHINSTKRHFSHTHA
jgi:hypothetical protein